MYCSVYNGVYFIEGTPAGAKIIGNISTVLDGVFRNAQLKTLDDVKKEMSLQVWRNGGNAVVAFKYGQHSMGFWRSLFSLDNVCWKGEGKIAYIDPASIP